MWFWLSGNPGGLEAARHLLSEVLALIQHLLLPLCLRLVIGMSGAPEANVPVCANEWALERKCLLHSVCTTEFCIGYLNVFKHYFQAE
jgi:hypothetical protein